MLLEENVVGKQEDWGQFVTIADLRNNPIMAWLPVGSRFVNVLHQYQADRYAEPEENAHVDGKDWTTFEQAGRFRKELKARAQWLSKTAAVSKLGQDVSNAAGVADEMAREITKKMTEMSSDFEATISSDQEAHEDDQSEGNKTRGIGKWIQNGAQSLYPVPEDYRTPTSSIYSSTKASLVEDEVQKILESLFNETGQMRTYRLFAGIKLKRRFQEFQFYLPDSLSTQATARVTNRQESGNRLGNTIDTYQGEGGTLELAVSRWLAHQNFTGGSSTKANWRGYILNRDMWQLRWNQRPRVYRPEFKGGSYKAAMDMIAMLVCKNPIAEGKIDPSDA